MTEFQICEIAVPTANDIEMSWVAEQSDAIFLADAVATLGNDDFFTPCRDRIPSFRAQSDVWMAALVAVEGVDTAALPRGERGLPMLSWDAKESGEPGRVLACSSVSSGTIDNTHVATMGVIVAEDPRRQGVGRAIIGECERIAREAGCRVANNWAEHQHPADDADALVPPTGVGAISKADPTTIFALEMGFELEQCERHSVCPFPIDEATCQPLFDEAHAKAEGYSLRTIQGPVPDDVVEAYCALLQHFSSEVPSAGLDVEEQKWDVERLRRNEERRVEEGRNFVLTLAIHDATGDVAAATELATDKQNPHVGFQEITIVDSNHRGHRLGMLVKIANARAFHEAYPEIQRVHTWNAGENKHMLAINDAMGFKEGIVEGAWQKKF